MLLASVPVYISTVTAGPFFNEAQLAAGDFAASLRLELELELHISVPCHDAVSNGRAVVVTDAFPGLGDFLCDMGLSTASACMHSVGYYDCVCCIPRF
jgi:hypothetical protein